MVLSVQGIHLLKPLFEASLLILLDAELILGIQCVFELMNYASKR